ncbi:hypothetical protein X560_1149 [Listeria fleischmannii 1991]|uniref:Uncharacterized protein n=1 Tax=Listeria fleischmannii 1991 TaxID=1430899 RepID=A0A0J8GHK3_9LIST|nr:hypothetical protein X560_1149 [Listeria fleischmannii 1991]
MISTAFRKKFDFIFIAKQAFVIWAIKMGGCTKEQAGKSAAAGII